MHLTKAMAAWNIMQHQPQFTYFRDGNQTCLIFVSVNGLGSLRSSLEVLLGEKCPDGTSPVVYGATNILKLVEGGVKFTEDVIKDLNNAASESDNK